MNFRAKSKTQQWTLWLCAGLVATTVYVVVSRLVFGSVSWAVFEPHRQRLVLPLVLLFWFYAWETRWDGIRREEGTGKRGQEGEGGVGNRCGAEEDSGSAGQPVDAASCRVSKEEECPNLTRRDAASTEKTNLHPAPAPNTCTSASAPSDDATGEELFDRARALPHQVVPDFCLDADYLNLLGASAAKGYAPALAKLGEYAMRRAAWVEAYYWMKQAQRNGMHGLSSTLREIRNGWATDGFPRQSSNVSEIFTEEAGRLGRALLRIDSGHEAAKAREFLKQCHPAYL